MLRESRLPFMGFDKQERGLTRVSLQEGNQKVEKDCTFDSLAMTGGNREQ
jgi:hypothetical protein